LSDLAELSKKCFTYAASSIIWIDIEVFELVPTSDEEQLKYVDVHIIQVFLSKSKS